MEFVAYQHLERLYHCNVEGILEGECHIFPKLDGTNGSIWLADNEVCCGSRKRELSLENDNAGFMKYILSNPKFAEYLKKHPWHRLIGEFLVKNAIWDYEETAWGKFYVFDVMIGEKYLRYDDYIKDLEEFGIEYIPRITVLNHPTGAELDKIESNFLMREGIGEGIVIKNYDFVNAEGNTIFAKILHAEFKSRWRKIKYLEKEVTLEDEIVAHYITGHFIDKEVAKNKLNGKVINPYELVGRIYHEFIDEEIWGILKKFKAPTINFRVLKNKAENSIREYIGRYHV